MRLLLAACAVLLAAPPASATNPLANPDFDTDVSSWTPIDSALAMTWNSLDVNGSPSSGSARLVNTLAGAGWAVGAESECLQGGLEYEVSGWAYIPSGQANSGRPIIGFVCYADSNCTNPILYVENSVPIPVAQWTKASVDYPLPPEASSARVYFGAVKDQAGGSFVLHWDAIDFQPVPEPVPTLSEPVVVALALLMFAMAIAALRRRARLEPFP